MEELKQQINTYFETLKKHGRTVSKNIKPAEIIFKKESRFLKYLDPEDLYCMFCYKPMVIIQIDYRTQRPVWGCLKDKATMGLQKIKWINHCGDCGRKLNLPQAELEYQALHWANAQVRTVCDKCIGNGNILTDEDMSKIQKKKVAN